MLSIPEKMKNELDVEDAKFLYNLFKDNMDIGIFREFINKFKTKELFNRYIK